MSNDEKNSSGGKNLDNKPTIQQYQDIVEFAHKEIEEVHSTYKRLGLLIAILIGVGTFFTYRSVTEFRQEIREDLKGFKQDIKDLKQEVETRVEKELGTEPIQNLIQSKVSERVDKVADAIIEKQIMEKVEPKIKDANSKLIVIDNKLKEAEQTRKELLAKSEFTLTVIAAQNDNRQEFEKLSSWAKDSSFPYLELANNTIIKIRTSYGGIVTPGYINVSWKEGIDPSELSFSILRKEYNTIPPHYHASLLNFIWKRNDIPKKDRMQFLVDVLTEDKSLIATFYAGKYFATEANIEWSPFVTTPLLSWWDKNKDNIE